MKLTLILIPTNFPIHTGNIFLFLDHNLGSLIQDSGAISKDANSSRTPYLGGPSFARAGPSYSRTDPEQNIITSQRLPINEMPTYRQSDREDRSCYFPNNYDHARIEDPRNRPATLLGRSEVSCTFTLPS